MKRNELWLGGLLAVAGFFGACTNVVEDESQNNKYPMELMAEKSAITFTRSIGEKTEWDGGESVSLYDGFSQKLYEVSQSGEMSAKNNDPLLSLYTKLVYNDRRRDFVCLVSFFGNFVDRVDRSFRSDY